MRRLAILIVFLIQIILASIAFAQTTQITKDLNYLAANQKIDSSWTKE